MNDQIKTISLAIIAIALVVQTFMQISSGGDTASVNTQTAGNLIQEQNQLTQNNPENAIEQPEASAQSNAPKTTMVFEKYEHDFGMLQDGEKVTYIFNFVNTGSNPLIISNAKGSCGCTVPEWPREPIPPGGKEKITVSYDSKNRSGNQEKTVSITANTEPTITQLKIKAQVAQEVKLGDNPVTTEKK